MSNVVTQQSNGSKPSGDELVKIFGIRTANDWLRVAKQRPAPKFLFGDLWQQGEMAMIFADTGSGKSVLGVQIGEALARGQGVGPLQNTAEPRTVLYLDCDLSDKQFEMRYTEDPDPGDDYLKNHHGFSDNFFRAQIDLNGEFPEPYASFEDYLMESMRGLIEHLDAKVLIVDNISFLKRSNESNSAAGRLMRELKRLKTELGISILVLGQTMKRTATRPLTANDISGFKDLARFADSVFAIGQSRIETDIRYLKHIKQRSGEMLYDDKNVPAFRVKKRDGNFLSFEFLRFTTEAVHLYNYGDEFTFKRVHEIKRFAAEGMSQRTIAAEMGISLGSVNKYLHMEYFDHRFVAESPELDPTVKANQFPDCDGFDCDLLENENERFASSTEEEWQRLDQQRLRLNNKRNAAQRQYWIATGKVPEPKKVMGYADELRLKAANAENHPDQLPGTNDSNPGTNVSI